MQNVKVQASQTVGCFTNNLKSTSIFQDFNTISGGNKNVFVEFNFDESDYTAMIKRNLYPAYSFNVLKKVFYAEIKIPSTGFHLQLT